MPSELFELGEHFSCAATMYLSLPLSLSNLVAATETQLRWGFFTNKLELILGVFARYLLFSWACHKLLCGSLTIDDSILFSLNRQLLDPDSLQIDFFSVISKLSPRV